MYRINKILKAYNCLPLYLFILFVFNILLLFLPLTKVFGFEFSAANSILLVLLSGFYSISLIKKIKKEVIKREVFPKLVWTMIISFVFIPAIISISHSVLTSFCSFLDGVEFYSVITVPSVIIGLSLGFISVFVTEKYPRIFFVLLFLLILLIPLLEFYFNPQVYFYNPIFGYFPGTIYDEGISLSLKLILYRISNLLFFGGIIFFIYDKVLSAKNRLKAVILACIFLIAVLFEYFSPSFGLATTFGKLKNDLSKRAESKHFVIYYPPTLNNNLVKAITIYHEYYYSELKRFFGFDYPGKIHSYLFLNANQKKNLFGSANADVAKPWLSSVFITYRDYESTLKHEIAHCYSSVFGSGIFKVAAGLNPSLIEGVAVAADPVYDGNTIDFMASLAFNNGYKVNISELFSGANFFTQTSSLSYIYAGSFCRYLISEFGIDKFKKFYNSGNFEKVYSFPLKREEGRYYSYLKQLDVTDKKDEANYYFGTKSIFYKVCPRFVASSLESAWNEYYKNNFTGAEKIFREILKTTNNYSAVIGYAECLSKENKYNGAIDFLLKNINQFKGSAYYYSMELKLGDLYAESNNFDKADSIYNEVSIQKPDYTYYYLSNLRRSLITDDSLIITYLKGSDFDRYAVLKKINEAGYNYYSFPVMITLSNFYEEGYDLFLNQFGKNFDVTDFAGSYAMFKLSNYMLQNLDFARARKTAALALRYKGDFNYNEIIKANYLKADWFYKNQGDVLRNTSITTLP